jgi:hypothetical protein
MYEVVSLDRVAEQYGEETADLAILFNHEVVEDHNGTWRWKNNYLFNLFLNDHPVNYNENNLGDAPFDHIGMQSARARTDLNELWRDFGNEKFPLEELIKFYMGIGYSLSGFWEVFGDREHKGMPMIEYIRCTHDKPIKNL